MSVHEALLSNAAGYRLWVNLDRTMLVRLWDSGVVEVCTRDFEGGIWGPPAELTEEKV